MRAEKRRAALRVAVRAAAFVLAAGAARPGYAQLPGSAPRSPATISIALLDVPLVQALETLSQQAQMNLVWQSATVWDRATKRVTCRHERVAPEVVLGCITKAVGLDFVRLSSGTYVVIGASAQPTAFASLGGRVLDAVSGAPLPQARLQLAEVPETVLTSDDGGFAFPRLAPGRYELLVRAVGYRPFQQSLEVPAGTAVPLRLTLTRSVAATQPIVINGLRAGMLSSAIGATRAADSAGLRALAGPALFLPGAAAPLGVARRDGTADLHLQGGDIGEHPWRLDGVPLYDVASLSGLLGVASPLAIDALTVHRSGFGAKAGSFATGVIDLTHAVAMADTAARLDVSADPVALSLRMQAPIQIGRARGAASVTGRTGTWQWTAPSALTRAMRHWSVPDPVLLTRLNVGGQGTMPTLENARFATSVGDEAVRLNDLHAATRLQIGLAHTVYASAFVNAHGVSYTGQSDDGNGHRLVTTDRYDWHTVGAQLSHDWLLGTRVRQHAQLRASQHALTHGGAMNMNGTSLLVTPTGEDNAITEVAVTGDWRIQLGSSTDVTLAAELTHNRAHLDLTNRVLRPLAYRTSVTRGTVLADVTRRVGASRFLDAGLRVTQLQTGATYAEPRLALRGEQPWLAGLLTWRLAAGGYHQFVNQFDVASTMPVAFVPSMRFWLPADGRSPVAQSWHTAAEFAFAPRAGWEIRAEAYARWHPSLPMFDYGAMFGGGAITPVTKATDFVQASRGRAVGGGARVIRDVRWGERSVRSELGYDGGHAVRRFPSRFDERLQPTPWLEPHRALWATEVQTATGLVLATRVRGVWGRPWALRQAYYDLFGAAPMRSSLPIDMPGVMRRPAIIDVDLGATYTRRVGAVRMETGASVLNAIGRRNVLDYGLRRDDNGVYRMVPRFLPLRQAAVTVRVSR